MCCLKYFKDQVIAWPKTGSYTFQLDSDDGSRMFLEGAWKELRIFGGLHELVAHADCIFEGAANFKLE